MLREQIGQSLPPSQVAFSPLPRPGQRNGHASHDTPSLFILTQPPAVPAPLLAGIIPKILSITPMLTLFYVLKCIYLQWQGMKKPRPLVVTAAGAEYTRAGKRQDATPTSF